MDKFGSIEEKALDLVRGAGRYGGYLSALGFEVTGLADWLEIQIPRVRRGLDAAATAIVAELKRAASEPGEDDQR